MIKEKQKVFRMDLDLFNNLNKKLKAEKRNRDFSGYIRDLVEKDLCNESPFEAGVKSIKRSIEDLAKDSGKSIAEVLNEVR